MHCGDHHQGGGSPSHAQPRQQQQEDDDDRRKPDAARPRQGDGTGTQRRHGGGDGEPPSLQDLVQAEDERGQQERGELGGVLTLDRRGAAIPRHPAEEVDEDAKRCGGSS